MRKSVAFALAIDDFQRARRQAQVERLISRLTGRSAELLSYETVRRQLRAVKGTGQGLREVPLAAIVGSTDRYDDFTRSFYPRKKTDQDRWAGVQAAILDDWGLPPIEVYQIGDAYFVQDGHHRVSVARRLGATYIEAYVTRVESRLPLSADVRPNDLILLAEQTELLERYDLDKNRPGADLAVTCPGKHPAIAEHIDIHRQLMISERGQEVSPEEAAVDWYDEVYLSMVRLIRQMGILRDFPGRTETDLYVWITAHHQTLQEELGWQLSPETLAADFVSKFSAKPRRRLVRLARRTLGGVLPGQLAGRRSARRWRRKDPVQARRDRLFADILVVLDPQAPDWQVLEQALEVAAGEEARVHGLCVLPTQGREEGIEAVAGEFEARCRARKVPGNLAVAEGEPLAAIQDRLRWVDLLVLGLDPVPGSQPATWSGLAPELVMEHSVCPILVVSGQVSALERLLLVTDGSKQARSALFLATYLALHRSASLAVLAADGHGQSAADVCATTQVYLGYCGVQARFSTQSGLAWEAVRAAVEQNSSDLVILAGSGDARIAAGTGIPVLLSFR